MTPSKRITFGPFTFDEANESVLRGSRAIPLRPKAFAVLKCLLERPGQLVTKEQLLDAVWPGTYVGDAVLKDSVRQLRDALDDDAQSPRYIETAHRRGYRFIGEIAGETTAPVAEPAAPVARPAAPPLVHVLGREAALAQMRGWLEHALGSDRQVVFVTGEPGIGKTTLVEAFLAEASAAHAVWVARGQCLEQYGAGEAYLPVLDGLSRLGRRPEGEEVVALLREHAPTWLAQMPRLVTAADRETLQRQAAGATRELMLREMADAVEAMTARTPLVLVLEDLHWSDYSTLDLVTYLARRRDPARLMVIGTYRPVEVILAEHPLKGVKRELQAHRLCKELPLEYLAEETVAQFLALRFPGSRFPARLARLVHRRTEGNPLFMVNVADYLLDEGLVAERDGEWTLEGDLEEVERAVPENVRHLIEKQIERLSPEEQRVLEGASAVGLECSTVAIAAGLDEEVTRVEEWCEQLVRRHHFLTPARVVELPDGTPTSRYRFNHSLYIDVPYGRIPALRRSQIHSRIGEAGERIYGDHVGEIAAELAMHFEQGRDWHRAAKYLRLAAENAADRSAHYEAIELARRGLRALDALTAGPERDGSELALSMTLGASLMTVKGFAAAELEEVFGSAAALCNQQEASPQRFAVLWSLGLFRVFRAELERAREIAAQLIEIATSLGDRVLRTEAHRALGVTLLDLGEFSESLEHLDLACALYEPGRHRGYTFVTAYDARVVSHSYAARAAWALGFPDRALERSREALSLARELAHVPSTIAAACSAATLHQLRREAPAVRELAATVVGLALEHGLGLWMTFGWALAGWAEAELGRVDDGIAQLRRSLAASHGAGARLGRTYYLGLLADALAKAGRTEEALAAVDEALTLVDETGERNYEAELHRIKGELVPDEAGARFRRAIAIARRQRALSWELRAAVSLARLEREREPLAEVYGRFAEGFGTPDLQEARALLDELT